MRRFLIKGPREEYFTRVTISGFDEDETDITECILNALGELDCEVFQSIEPRESDDAEET